MHEYTIDIKAKYISDKVKVWRMFPGRSYVALPTFIAENVVFLDLPGLQLPAQTSGDKTIPQLRERIAMSRSLQVWYRILRRLALDPVSCVEIPKDKIQKGLVKEGILKKPSDKLDEYKGLAEKISGSDIGSVLALFRSAQAGDLILVPDQYRNRRVFVGELTDGPDVKIETSLDNKYGTSKVIGRPIKWLDSIDEARLPIDITKSLRLPNPMSALEGRHRLKIFDEVYKNYYTTSGYCSRFYTNSEDFTSTDNLNFNIIINSITKLLSEICAEEGTTETELLELAIAHIPPEYISSISCYINSPGFFELKSSSLSPFMVAIFLSLLCAGDANAKPAPQSVKIENSLGTVNPNSPADPCVVQVTDVVRETLNRMNLPVWKAACERAKELKNSTKMNNIPEVRKHNDVSKN